MVCFFSGDYTNTLHLSRHKCNRLFSETRAERWLWLYKLRFFNEMDFMVHFFLRCATNQNLAYAKGYTSVFILIPSRYPPWLLYKQALFYIWIQHTKQ